jgi:hypothetical protein
MKINIDDFVSLSRMKNGKLTSFFNTHNEGNIYKFLRELGYCKSKLDNKQILYQRSEFDVSPVELQDIKHHFYMSLHEIEFIDIPDTIEREDILNWYLKKDPIKENGLFNEYLKDHLTETEAEELRLKTNPDYKLKFEVQQLISKLYEWNFNKTTDSVGAFCKDRPLYYRNISDRKFLIFSHTNLKNNDNFDCWTAEFTDENHIGLKPPLERNCIEYSFKLDRHFDQIKDFLNL